jgi:hypothetical protein
MKRYVEEEKEETTNKLTNYTGIVFEDGKKGIVLNFGMDNTMNARYHIITNGYANGNDYYGDFESDGTNVRSVLAINGLLKNGTIYCSDSYKELIQWFADSIED